MAIEWEATFLNINKDLIRQRLKTTGAKLLKPEFLQKRTVFFLPPGQQIPGAWLRVRDEVDRVTMSLKIVNGNKIENQEEICLVINDYATGIEFLKSIGCKIKATQESKREIWDLSGVEICIDEWPYLEPYVEIEGKNAAVVKATAQKLQFDYQQARFCSVATLYSLKYNIPVEDINNRTPNISFNAPNPFLKFH